MDNSPCVVATAKMLAINPVSATAAAKAVARAIAGASAKDAAKPASEILPRIVLC